MRPKPLLTRDSRPFSLDAPAAALNEDNRGISLDSWLPPARPEDVAQQLSVVIHMARTAHPTVAIAREKFFTFVVERLPLLARSRRLITTLPAADLYLACAASLGDLAGLAAFETKVVAVLPKYIHGRLRGWVGPEPDASFIVETVAEFRAGLLEPNECGQRGVSSYTGRSSLLLWARNEVIISAVARARRALTEDQSAAKTANTANIANADG